MEKNVSSLKISNIILCVILLVTFVIATVRTTVKANELVSSDDEVYPSISFKLGYHYPSLANSTENKQLDNDLLSRIVILDYNYYIKANLKTIEFFSEAFGYQIKDVIDNLKEINQTNEQFISTNIGCLKNKEGKLYVYDSFEYGLIEYFYNLNKTGKLKQNKKYIPYEGNSTYIENLIIYYSGIYQNVDKTTILSIGAAESGYYKVKFMLKYNNVYGGMSSKGLIKHDNIELGVLSYVRMMSKNYYVKGLNTVDKIGKVYCPIFVNNVKTASPHWINLVNSAKEKYKDYEYNITINDLINEIEAI